MNWNPSQDEIYEWYTTFTSDSSFPYVLFIFDFHFPSLSTSVRFQGAKNFVVAVQVASCTNVSRVDWRNGYRNGGRTISLARTRKEFIHACWSPSNRAIPSIRKGSLFVRGFIVRSSNASKCRSGRRLGRVTCYQLYNTYVRKVVKLCRDNFNEKQINKSEEIGFRVRRDTEFRTRLRCKDLYRFLCEILFHGMKSSSMLIYLRSFFSSSSFIRYLFTCWITYKWTFERKKRNTLNQSVKECGIYLCELRGKRPKRFISNLSSDTKFSLKEIVGKIGVDRDGRIGYTLTDDWFFFYLRSTLSKYPKSMLSSVSYVIRPEAMKCICHLRPMDQKGQIYCYRLNIPGSKVGTPRGEQRNLEVHWIRSVI